MLPGVSACMISLQDFGGLSYFDHILGAQRCIYLTERAAVHGQGMCLEVFLSTLALSVQTSSPSRASVAG